MTLITYPTRVHFADGVLEEALHSELERAGIASALLVSDQSLAESAFMDRVLSGMPSRVLTDQVAFCAGDTLRDVATETVRKHQPPDVIVAFGTAQAIELGRKIRFSVDQAGAVRPILFAVPAVDGLPDPCNRNLESKQAGLPSVVICDPTVSLGTRQGESLRATVMSLIRCVEAYLSMGYNPPADGMALDGLNRCIASLEKFDHATGIDLHREVMAAGLNAFMSQEKGVGPAQTITSSLLGDVGSDQRAAIARLVLPGIMRARAMDDGKADMLRKVLSEADEPLTDATERILGGVALPRTLAALGVPHEALDTAAQSVAGNAGLTFQNARSVLEDVYESA